MKRFILGALSLLMIAFAFSACLKSDTNNTGGYRDPSLERDTIQKYIVTNGLTMVEDPRLQGFMYQIIAPGSTTDTISNTKPVVDVKYQCKLLNNTLIEETNKATFDLSRINLIPSFTYSLSKIGKGGHIRFVAPSAYCYGNYSQGKIPANSPLYYDIELLDVRAQ